MQCLFKLCTLSAIVEDLNTLIPHSPVSVLYGVIICC